MVRWIGDEVIVVVVIKGVGVIEVVIDEVCVRKVLWG